jgi:hypothetical protein
MPTRVNGEVLDENEIAAEEQAMLPRLAEAMRGEPRSAVLARAREWARENVIDRVLLRQAAWNDSELSNSAGDAPAESNCLSRDNEEELRARLERLTARLTAKLQPPKAKEITEYYRRNSGQLYLPEMVRAAHIVRNVDEKTSEDEARSAIEKVVARIAQGEDFAAVADELSDCPGRGGDLGFFPRGQMVPEFDDAVFALRPGEVSGIFRTPFGFHVAKVIEYRPEGIPKLDDVREQIANVLYAEKRQRAIDRFVDQLRAKAVIETV